MPYHPLDYAVVLGSSVLWARAMLTIVLDALDDLL